MSLPRCSSSPAWRLLRSPGRSRPAVGPGVGGFTLLEVLVSLTIFVLAAIVLGSAYLNIIQSYDRVMRGAQDDENIRFARSFLLAQAEREEVEKGGDFEVDDARVTWRGVIEPTNVADLFDVAFICEITSPAQPRPVQVEQRFRLLRPTWSDSLERQTLRDEARDRIVEIQQALANP